MLKEQVSLNLDKKRSIDGSEEMGETSGDNDGMDEEDEVWAPAPAVTGIVGVGV